MYIATERLRPLESIMREWEVGGGLATAGKGGKEQWIGWGVQRIAVSSCLSPELTTDCTGFPEFCTAVSTSLPTATYFHLRNTSIGMAIRWL